MALTEEQRSGIGDALADAAASINAYIKKHADTISEEDRGILREYFRILQRAATTAVTEAVEQAIAGLKNPVAELTGITKDAKHVIDIAKSVQRDLAVMAGLADLGAGIVAGDPGAVLKAVTNLDKVIKEGAANRKSTARA